MGSEQTEKIYIKQQRDVNKPKTLSLLKICSKGVLRRLKSKQRETNDLQGRLTQTSHFMD